MQKQQKMKNPRNPHGYEDFLGEDCWIRTSDLLRVKNCTTHGAGGHAPRIQHDLKNFALLKLSSCMA